MVKSVSKNIVQVSLCTLIILSFGCRSNSNSTVGIRIFNPAPRFDDESVWFVLTNRDSSEDLLRVQLHKSHSPTEIYGLTKNLPVLVRIVYTGLQKRDGDLQQLEFTKLLDMNNDVDISVRWIPLMSSPSKADSEDPNFNWTSHWMRHPELIIEQGHDPFF